MWELANIDQTFTPHGFAREPRLASGYLTNREPETTMDSLFMLVPVSSSKDR